MISHLGIAKTFKLYFGAGSLFLFLLFVLATIYLAFSSNQSYGFISKKFILSNGNFYNYSVFLPYVPPEPSGYPLIFYLHGGAGIGEDGQRQLLVGLGPAVEKRKKTFPFIVVFPQARVKNWRSGASDTRVALSILDDIVKSYPVDSKRIYLVGTTVGAEGAWSLAYSYPERWAALVSVSGYGNPSRAPQVKDIPSWFFHNSKDPFINPDYSRKIVAALRDSGGSPKYTEFPSVHQDAWTRAYDSNDLYAWLLNQKLSKEQPLSSSSR